MWKKQNVKYKYLTNKISTYILYYINKHVWPKFPVSKITWKIKFIFNESTTLNSKFYINTNKLITL